MNKHDILLEAFKSMNEISLNEETFDIDDETIDNLNDVVNPEDENSTVDVIDPEIEDEEDIDKKDYIGDVIIQCEVCHSNIFKHKDEIEVDEDRQLANTDDICPYCGEANGFTIVGQIVPFVQESENEEPEESVEDETSDEVSVDVDGETVVDADDTVVEESVENSDSNEITETIDTIKERYINDGHIHSTTEGIETIEINTEDNTVHITTNDDDNEEKKEDEIMIEPIEEPVQDEIISDEESSNVEVSPEDDIEEIDITDIEEESFNRLGTRYLRKIYENVNSFETTDAQLIGNKIKLEGTISFKSGKRKDTSFVFEAKDMTRSGKVRFIGENKSISSANKAFTLTGVVTDGKLITEGLTYNYSAKDKNGKHTLVTGTVNINKRK